jgi:hypothetical protein
MIEETLGPYERKLLLLNKGKTDGVFTYQHGACACPASMRRWIPASFMLVLSIRTALVWRPLYHSLQSPRLYGYPGLAHHSSNTRYLLCFLDRRFCSSTHYSEVLATQINNERNNFLLSFLQPNSCSVAPVLRTATHIFRLSRYTRYISSTLSTLQRYAHLI